MAGTYMLKIQSFLLFMLLAVVAHGQSGSLSYTGVVAAAKNSKESLHQKALKWLAGAYMNTQAAMVMNDNGAELSAKATYSIKYDTLPFNCATGHINYSVYLYFKDGRYRYEITDFVHEGSLSRCSFGMLTTDKECPEVSVPREWSDAGATKVWGDIKQNVTTHTDKLLRNLEQAMKGKVSEW